MPIYQLPPDTPIWTRLAATAFETPPLLVSRWDTALANDPLVNPFPTSHVFPGLTDATSSVWKLGFIMDKPLVTHRRLPVYPVWGRDVSR